MEVSIEQDVGVTVEVPIDPSPPALTIPEKIDILATATAATTLRLTKEQRVKPLLVDEFAIIGCSFLFASAY